MASVYEVYSTLKALANKDTNGMITPSQFNKFAGVAQQCVVNDLFNDLVGTNRLGVYNFSETRPSDSKKKILEDLSVFSKTTLISAVAGTFQKPDDLFRIISMSTMGNWVLDRLTSNNIELIYDEEKLERILRSTLSIPTDETPVALISNDIQVFPTSVKNIKLRYYKTPEGVSPIDGSKTPALPSFGYTVAANGTEVYDPTTSVDFELPNHYIEPLVIEIAEMMGVSLRQSDLYNYAQTEEQEDKKLK